ncbi:Fic family protein [Planctomicrobium sp. SH668]|uniref:Fic family protein n=1 Tax=Planctomicrobium sp. SH668 TaxID=3448126 RepID=UPI003F5B8EF8
MNLGPVTDSCPAWNDEIPLAMVESYKTAHRLVYSDVLNCAKNCIVNDDSFKRWHRILFDKCTPVDYYAGNYRQNSDKFPCLACDVAVGNIPGSFYWDVLKDVENLSNNLKKEVSRLELHWGLIEPVDRAKQVAILLAVAIGTFIRIHPFVNKNGHVSRLIWRWGLARFGVPLQCRISPRPDQPYGEVMASSMNGNDGPLAKLILLHLCRNPPSLNA